MSHTLYRKYRPQNFSEIIGQKHIVQTLSNAVKNNRVGQAYLFTGPRGTGKTSIARIFAKTINCENLKNAITCEKCQPCKTISEGRSLDIIEIDAASNTGVDNIRELRETVALPATSLKHKVYIIDEVHMLSSGAFNALLKTLEEPPAHVVFILATTEIHKVPETILSRCQRFDFARLPIQNIIEKLSLIAKSEKIKIEKSALEMIAIAAEGGMRDAESLLAQVIALEDKNITAKEVEEILGTADRRFSFEIAEMIIGNDSQGAIEKINSLLAEGYDLQVFTKTLINYLRQLMLLKVNPELKSTFSSEITAEQMEKMIAQSEKIELQKIISAINLFLDAQGKISAFMLPQLPLEIAIIKATRTFPSIEPSDKYQAASDMSANVKTQSARPPMTGTVVQAKPQFETENPNKTVLTEKAEEKNQKKAKARLDNAMAIDVEIVKQNWNKLLEEIKPYNHSLKVLLSNCQVEKIIDNEIILTTPYDFYKERLNETKNRLTVEEVFGKILGLKISLKIITNKEAGMPINTKQSASLAETQATGEKKQSPLLASALEIMGGKIVEE